MLMNLFCYVLTFFLIVALGSPDASAQQAAPETIPPEATIQLSAPPHSIPSPRVPGEANTGPGTSNTVTSGGAPVNPDLTKKDPLAVLETSKGTITIRLFAKFAPNTVFHFMELSRKGFYNGLTFHRVEPGFVIQGGCPQGNGSGVYMDPATNQPRFLSLEIHPNLRHNTAGVVAMAHFGRNPNSASCQFYITLSAQPKLDGKYTIFGGVVDGLSVATKIAVGDKIVSVKIQDW